jgi:putative AdoMet-dependent methyltransferase
MLDNRGFDLWADGYDKSVGICEDANAYPFAGYRDVLNGIYKEIRSKRSASVLDIGFGTALLTKKLYDDGCEIYGIDFSERMTAIAKEKMPRAKLLCHDFSKGIPEELSGLKFDYIISTYALHHLTDMAKADFIKQLSHQLSPNGSILIGDVIFETRDRLDLCRKENADAWDSEEIYIVFDEWKTNFPKERITFTQVSHCAGIITIKGA